MEAPRIVPILFGLGVLGAAAFACSDDTTNPSDPNAVDGSTTNNNDGSVSNNDGGTNPGEDGSIAPSGSLTWTKATITGADSEKVGAFLSMAYGNGHWVAFAEAHEGGVIDNNGFALVSPDGKTWSVTQKFGLRHAMVDIAYFGATFVAVGKTPDGEGGTKNVYGTSADGATWTFVDGPGVGTDAIAAGADLAVWGGEDGLTTTYATAQTPIHHSANPLSVNVRAMCNVGTRFIATGQLLTNADDGKPLFLYSDSPTNDLAWTAGVEPATITRVGSIFRGIYCDEQIQVAVGAGKDVFVSTDKGATWKLGVKEGDSTTWTRVKKANGKIVIVGWKGVYGVMTGLVNDAADLAVGNIGLDRNFDVAASDGTIVVTGSGGQYNDKVPGVIYWTAP